MKITTLVAVGAIGLSASAAFGQSAPIVVELFTSQGCSSCPPADGLLAELAAMDGVLPLALHVDYWDYIGWKDTFGSAQFTARQKAYASAAGHRTIYTPQMVIGGRDHVVGYVPMDVASAIEKHRDSALPISLVLQRENEVWKITAMPMDGLPQGMIVQLIRFSPMESVTIERGENAGKTIDYVNIVKSWEKLGTWDGTAPLDLTAPTGAGRTAVILQSPGPGEILAAAVEN